jgi:hypothetical protein
MLQESDEPGHSAEALDAAETAIAKAKGGA